MKTILLLSLLFFLPLFLAAQELTGIATKWSDDFREWTIYTANDGEGELRMRWQLQNDWTEWEYRIGEATGTIKMKWTGNPNEWEIRGDNKIITARTVFPNDPTQWRITDNSTTLLLKSRWANNLEEWNLRSESYGNFELYTEWEGDPRSWAIVDELDSSISFPMKMALAFLVVFHNAPKG